ncbi:hypothetical protein [Arthrobacter sp. 2MCAF14]|uniref:hypothetical protein n=1 Tax=Arthrobacter sp. 2MCAF14 TaxID=3232982 RepID=UPI003F8D9CD6
MGWTTGPDRKPLTLRRSRSTADAAQTPALGRVGAVLAAAAVLVFAPGIAQAAFNGSASAALPISSATLASSATVTASCSGSKPKIKLTSWALPDPRFVGVFTVTNGGNVLFTATSTQGSTASYTPTGNPNRGTIYSWTVQNQYPVPGTSNIWTGASKTGQVTC